MIRFYEIIKIKYKYIMTIILSIFVFNFNYVYAADSISDIFGVFNVGIFDDIIDAIVDFFSDILGWIKEFMLDILEIFIQVIFGILENILQLMYDIILEHVILTANELYENGLFSDYIDKMIYLGIGLLFLLTVYSLIKGLFAPLGFISENPLNIFITFILLFLFISAIKYISFAIIALQDTIVQVFITPGLEFNVELVVKEYDNFAQLFTDIIIIFIIISCIMKLIDLAARFTMRIAIIIILVMMGPLAIAAGVVKSNRIITLAWFKTILSSNLIYIFKVIMFLFMYTFFTAGSTLEILDLLIILGFVYSIENIENIFHNIVSGMGGGAGKTDYISARFRKTYMKLKGYF